MNATAKQAAQIAEFIAIAATNGVTIKGAALPRNHKMIVSRNVMQIRKVADRLAWGHDELGNTVVLLADGGIRQILAEEMAGDIKPATIKPRAEMIADLAAKFGKSIEFAAKRLASMTDAVMAEYHRDQMAA